MTRIENFLLRNGGKLTEEVIGDRREEKSEEGRLEPEISGAYSDGEGSVGPDADFVDAIADTEVELCLPLEVDMKLREDVPAYSRAVYPVDLGQDDQRRFEPTNRAKPKSPTHGLSLPLDMEPRRQLSGATAQVGGAGACRRRQGTADPTYPGLAQRRQSAGIKTPTSFDFGKASGLQSPDGQSLQVAAGVTAGIRTIGRGGGVCGSGRYDPEASGLYPVHSL